MCTRRPWKRSGTHPRSRLWGSTRGKATDQLVSLLAERLLGKKEQSSLLTPEGVTSQVQLMEDLPLDGIRTGSPASLSQPSEPAETEGREEVKVSEHQDAKPKRYKITLVYDDNDMAVAKFASRRPAPKICTAPGPETGISYTSRQLRAQGSLRRVRATPRGKRISAVDGVLARRAEDEDESLGDDCGQKEV